MDVKMIFFNFTSTTILSTEKIHHGDFQFFQRAAQVPLMQKPSSAGGHEKVAESEQLLAPAHAANDAASATTDDIERQILFMAMVLSFSALDYTILNEPNQPPTEVGECHAMF